MLRIDEHAEPQFQAGQYEQLRLVVCATFQVFPQHMRYKRLVE